jgi:hypothetical protein
VTGPVTGPPAGLPPLPEGGLRRFLERPRPRPAPGEVCEMCAEPIGDFHGHVVNLEARNLMCCCRGCTLLFTSTGAAQGRYKAVPSTYLYDQAAAVTQAQWDTLQVPVGIAFFFRNSTLGRTVAFYPSPAGATESMLELDTWDELLAANPDLAGPEPDVEALLVRRSVPTPGAAPVFECWLVPIDACYELVGRVKKLWRGFDGGAALWADLDAFLASLRERSRPVGHGAAADRARADRERG